MISSFEAAVEESSWSESTTTTAILSDAFCASASRFDLASRRNLAFFCLPAMVRCCRTAAASLPSSGYLHLPYSELRNRKAVASSC